MITCVPPVERQLNEMIHCFPKFHNIAYDVQGMNDRGTDVLLRYSEESEIGESARCISLQIKSFDDLDSKTYLRDLKTQTFEAHTEYHRLLERFP